MLEPEKPVSDLQCVGAYCGREGKLGSFGNQSEVATQNEGLSS